MSQGSVITSPDEGFDDLDCGMSFSSLPSQDSGTSHTYFQQTPAFDSIYGQESSAGRSFNTDLYIDVGNNDKASPKYMTIQPAELALILKAGFDKVSTEIVTFYVRVELPGIMKLHLSFDQ